VAFYDKPFLKFERLLETIAAAPRLDPLNYATGRALGSRYRTKGLLVLRSRSTSR